MREVNAVQKFEASNPDFASKLEKFIYDMPIAQFFGLRFIRLEPGLVEMEMPFRKELSFVEGTLQAGPIGTLLDFTAGCAASSLLPADWAASTIDFTVKLIAPAKGERFIARGRCVSRGKSISVAEARAYAVSGSRETLCAAGLVSMRNFALA